jgi:deazaflavin-dependent oxidoreductase (nitroreductase family)
MTEQNSADKMRAGFRTFNRFMVALWRLGLGRFVNWSPRYGGRIMVITHNGRKSGIRRQSPVNYAIIDDDLYCTAGFGKNCDWYKNIKTNPGVEVWLPDGWYEGVAEEVTNPELRLPILREVLKNSGFASYAAGVDPYGISDEQLESLTREYKLVRIHRTGARTGRGGPGEFSWVWPLATFVLLPMVFIGRGKRKRCC